MLPSFSLRDPALSEFPLKNNAQSDYLRRPSSPELMRVFRIADGLNTMTRRGEIGTSLPVLGLRPTRWPLMRTTNEPNEDSFTVSPRSRQSVIPVRTSPTRDAHSVSHRPTFWVSALH